MFPDTFPLPLFAPGLSGQLEAGSRVQNAGLGEGIQTEEYKEIISKLQNKKVARTLRGSELLKAFQSLGND